MNAEDQRIAIAEACGWTNVRDTAFGLFGCCPGADLSVLSDDYLCARPIPDYINDLNAMHEAERAIGLHGDNFRGRMLRRSWGTYTAFLDSRFLTASERAQAILMTIKKWTYDN